MINKVVLIGELQDFTGKLTDEGLEILIMTVRTWEGNRTPSQFHRVVMFDKTSVYIDIFTEIKERGEKILLYVEGSLRYNTIEKNGTKRKYASIVANKIRILSPTKNKKEIEKPTSERKFERKNENMVINEDEIGEIDELDLDTDLPF